MRLRHYLFVALLALLPLSCIQEGAGYEEEAAITVDSKNVSVSADACRDTILVSANRGWTIMNDTSCEWLSFESMESINLSGLEQTVPIVLIITGNNEFTARETSFQIKGVGCDETVQVHQAGLLPTFSVDSPLIVNDINYLKDTVEISINTNIDWTASVKDGATATVTLLSESGSKSGILKAEVAENTDVTTAKTAVVLISAPGFDPIEVTLNQKKAEPNIRTVTPVQKAYLDPAVISSMGGMRWFEVKSNVPWTAEVDTQKSTATGITLVTESGDGDLDQFKVKVAGANLDLDNTKKVVINFKYEGQVLCSHELTQEKGSIIAFEFKNQNDSNPSAERVWQFADPETAPPSASAGTGEGSFKMACGIELGYNVTKAYIAGEGLYVTSKSTHYLVFPAIAGRKLTKVTIVKKETDTKPVIKDGEVNDVEGGAFNESTFEKSKRYTYNLSGTVAGANYRLYLGADKTMKLSLIELEYE